MRARGKFVLTPVATSLAIETKDSGVALGFNLAGWRVAIMSDIFVAFAPNRGAYLKAERIIKESVHATARKRVTSRPPANKRSTRGK